MIVTANLLLLSLGFVLISIALIDFTRSFAIWCALFPIVMRLRPFENVPIPSCRFITVSLFLAALFKLQHLRGRFPRTSFWNTYILFLVLAAISAAISTQPTDALIKTFTYTEPLMWATMAAVATLSTPNGLRIISRGILWGVVGVTGYALVEIFYQRNILYDVGLLQAEGEYMNEVRFGLSGRIMSTIGQPVGTSLYFVCTIPLALFYGQYLTKSTMARLLCLLIILSGSTALIATGTRAGYIGIFVVPTAYYLLSSFKQRSLLVLVSAYAAFFLVVQYLLPPEFIAYVADSFDIARTVNNPAVGSTLGRIELTGRLLDIARAHPFFGLGPGYVPRMDAARDPTFLGLGGSENQYAMLLVEIGIIGVLGYASFLFSAFRLLVHLRRDTDVVRAQWSALSGSIVVSILLVAVSVTVIASLPMMIIMTYLGVAVVLDRQMRLPRRVQERHAFQLGGPRQGVPDATGVAATA